MEVLAPLALAAFGTVAASGMTVRTGGEESKIPVKVGDNSKKPDPRDFTHGLDANNYGLYNQSHQPRFNPIAARVYGSQVPGRTDNLPLLQTSFKDPKYELRPEDAGVFAYDQQNRGSTHLENQWYYSNMTTDAETPLSMGYLPQYTRSTGIMLRDPDTPEMLKPKKRELTQEEVFMAQPEQDRRFYNPLQPELERRAQNESKLSGATGALDTYIMNDRPGMLGGPTRGFAKGLEMTREFTGYHPRQRFFREDDNRRQRNPHGLRAGLKTTQVFDGPSMLGGFTTHGKKDQIATYHSIPTGYGGRKQAHLPDALRAVELRHTQREGPPAPTELQ